MHSNGKVPRRAILTNFGIAALASPSGIRPRETQGVRRSMYIGG